MQAGIHLDQRMFAYYMGFGLATGILTIALVSVSWWKLNRQDLKRRQRLLLIVFLLTAAERIIATGSNLVGSASGEHYFPLGGYYFGMADILALVITLLILGALLSQIAVDSHDRQRLQGEMEAGRSAQLLLLGSDLAIATNAFSVDLVYEPALEVGGDFYWTRI